MIAHATEIYIRRYFRMYSNSNRSSHLIEEWEQQESEHSILYHEAKPDAILCPRILVPAAHSVVQRPPSTCHDVCAIVTPYRKGLLSLASIGSHCKCTIIKTRVYRQLHNCMTLVNSLLFSRPINVSKFKCVRQRNWPQPLKLILILNSSMKKVILCSSYVVKVLYLVQSITITYYLIRD